MVQQNFTQFLYLMQLKNMVDKVLNLVNVLMDILRCHSQIINHRPNFINHDFEHR